MKDKLHPHPKTPGHPSETVIHHYGEDQTLLAQWLRRGIQKGPMFWALVAGVIVVAIALMLFLSGLSAVDTSQHKAWIELVTAKTPDEKEAIAEAHPTSRAARWARLHAAEALFNEGVDSLVTNRVLALPLLNRAYTQFEQVERAAGDGPLDETLKRLAAMGMARVKEARGELEAAIDQYNRVASSWPGTPDAERAEHLAQELRRPESMAFYEKLSAYKPAEVSLPPMGTGSFNFPPGHPSVDGSSIPSPSFPPNFPLRLPTSEPGAVPPLDMPEGPPTDTPPAAPRQPEIELPKDPFENLPPPAPQAETPKPASAGGVLPGDVFTPSPKP